MTTQVSSYVMLFWDTLHKKTLNSNGISSNFTSSYYFTCTKRYKKIITLLSLANNYKYVGRERERERESHTRIKVRDTLVWKL